jgi:hypothetical protein
MPRGVRLRLREARKIRSARAGKKMRGFIAAVVVVVVR